ncbi:type I toxin-antitoxin system SymE family toxin [Xanthomonas campestris pv. incanae]|nr:type I toxin-antitoxin system SymE family toxin [Xanthomonas campestris pv. incanae]
MPTAQLCHGHARVGLFDKPDDLLGAESALLHVRPLGFTDFIASAGTAQWGQVTEARPPRPGHPRAPQHCTVGYGYYPASDQRVPTLRLRGRWLEQLGFTIGSKLHIRLRDGELVVSVAPTD